MVIATSDRKLRLFLAAYWRWHGLKMFPRVHARLVEAAFVAEDWAETGAKPATIPWECIPLEESPSEGMAKTMQIHFGDERDARVNARRASLLACVVSNLAPPVAFQPAWRTPPVFTLAVAAYEDRRMPSGELDAQRLSVLADALEEVGAADDVVGHLRSKGPHVRGCWCVDLCLAKK
jgi:hypothetical protein